MNYNHLRYFWAVAHDGNLTRTAQRMNLSQSALSVQIKKLEDRLGHALFERRGRQLILTEAGRITLDYADTIFEAGKDLLGTLRQQGRVRQVLRVGALATLSRNFQLEFLRPLLGNNDIELVLRSGTLPELLQGLETLSLDVVQDAWHNIPPVLPSSKSVHQHLWDVAWHDDDETHAYNAHRHNVHARGHLWPLGPCLFCHVALLGRRARISYASLDASRCNEIAKRERILDKHLQLPQQLRQPLPRFHHL